MKYKNNVYKDYEIIADWFDQHRSRELFEKPYLDKVISYLHANSKILDVGCGMGEPIAQYFITQGFDVTGIDGSSRLIELAQDRFPSAQWIVQDMRNIQFDQKFDCIIAWHSLFHLPMDDQRNMFAIFADCLQHQGVLLFTSGHESSEVWSNNGGQNLYHASLSEQEYTDILQQYGFEIILHVIQDKDCGDATVWLARLL